MEKWMGMGLLIFLIKSTMKESGKMGHVMAKAHSHPPMEENGEASLKMTGYGT